MNKNQKILLLTFFGAIFLWIYSGGIKWGTPLLKRSMQIFNNETELKEYAPKMVKLREKYYKKRNEIYAEKGSVKTAEIKKAMNEVWGHSEKSGIMGEVPREVVLDAVRSYFISTNLSDEGQSIFPLTAMNPKKLDFDPKFYIYGGLYYYTVGAALATGKILGLISLSRDTYYYFFNPEETANIYAIVRGLNVLFALLSAFVIYFIALKIFENRTTAIISMLFFLFSPILFLQTHLSKPHVISMFFLTCGLFALGKTFDSDEKKYKMLSGISLGLAAACLVTNLIFISFLLIADIIKKKKISWHPYILFFVSFAIPNYFLFIHFEMFLRYAISLKIYSGYSTFNLNEILKFFAQSIPWGMHLIVIPLIFLGLTRFALSKRHYGMFLVCAGTLFFVYNVLMLRHAGVLLIGYPFIALYLAAGTEYLNIFKKTLRPIFIVYLAIVFYILSAKVFYYRHDLFVRYGNMTLAGEWINKNIPVGSNIGIQGGWPIPGDVPAFRFLKYRLINLPFNSTKDTWKNQNIPEYIITKGPVFDAMTSFGEKYKMINEWPEPNKFMGLRFERGWVPTENIDVRIYKKVRS
jgi:hypothetical protein